MSYNNYYLHRFFKLNTAPFLLSLKVFPNLKEITESFAAFAAIQDNLVGRFFDRSDDIDVYVVGDGHTPRTGALIACLTKWNVYSIDPLMRPKKWDVKRLITYRGKSSDFKFSGKTALIVCVHSHAPISECLQMVEQYESIHLINIPCCFKADIETEPALSYIDDGIQSEKKRVDIYINLKHNNNASDNI